MKTILSLFIGLFLSSHVYAVNVLDSLVRPNWPNEYNTVHEVANYFLEPYGYKLVIRDDISRTVASYSPALQRNPTKTITIKEALLRMVPPEFSIVVDVNSKRITYDLTRQHRTTHIAQPTTITQPSMTQAETTKSVTQTEKPKNRHYLKYD